MLRASEVTAALRLTSLVRGRLEIARLDLTEPSLNLVHGDNGRWNLEALLERAAHIPLAPTAKTKSEPRPGFPYIDATSARINFKNGPEKKPYALTNADFSSVAGFGEYMGRPLEGPAVAQRFELERHGPAAGERDLAARRNASRNTAAVQPGMEPRRSSASSQNSLPETTKGWRGDVQLDVDAGGNSGEAADQRATRRFKIFAATTLPAAKRCAWPATATGNTVRWITRCTRFCATLP